MLDMVCKICGKEFNPNDTCIKELEEHQMCFSCNFWREHYEKDKKRPPHTVAIIDGTHYIIESEDDTSSFRGFSGAKFQIEFNDGTKVVTTNLWCQGEPKGYYKSKFPDNARFENNLKWKSINGTQYLISDETKRN